MPATTLLFLFVSAASITPAEGKCEVSAKSGRLEWGAAEMVVLSAAIVTTGKTLLARQFVEMTRLRIEGLISAFQKLVDTGKDHTFIETETVRYVYQPIEAMQLVLVTNKSSNILEETLRRCG
ncbi:unnamed protein product [Prorocentrum cordatum]|uniref:Coatomer subunit delta n=1 Tax=Prorocentrum cordatum TaxID=2364126 RepID=A0ABN9UVT8_9DINO|nr:unnamed protein product [Polarella glacialis]